MKATVLIVSDYRDIHSDIVGALLERDYGLKVEYCSVAHYPTQMLSSWHSRVLKDASVCDNGVGFGLSHVSSIWWHQPGECQLPEMADEQAMNFVQMQSGEYLEGLLWSKNCFWVNEPLATRKASRKIVQLELAQSLGMNIPETIITNDPDQADKFIRSAVDRVLVKPVATSRIRFLDSHWVDPDQPQILEILRNCPAILQQHVEAESDLKVIYIDGALWAVATDNTDNQGFYDDECSEDKQYDCFQLSSELSKQLQSMMQTLNLKYAAVDLRLGLDGKFYFLQLEPHGSFWDIQLKTGLPLAQAMAKMLAAPCLNTEQQLETTSHNDFKPVQHQKAGFRPAVASAGSILPIL